MSTTFRLPDVGEGIHEAEVIRWLVEEGQMIQEFEPLLEIQTDKAVVELPAPASGRIGTIRVQAGQVARVGDALVDIGDGSRQVELTSQQEQENPRMAAQLDRPLTEPQLHRPLATPGVRHYARQQGIDLKQLTGSGRNGRILKTDVDAAKLPSQPRDVTRAPNLQKSPKPVSGERIPFRGIRKATADHVTKAAFTAPHVTAFEACDVTALVALRKQWNASRPADEKLSYLPFLIKVLISGLRAFPYLNARLDEAAEEIELLSSYHIGIAVDTDDGLFVPVIRDADALSITELADELKRLVRGVQTRALPASDLRGSTFTITNMGPIGGLFATPILNYPEVGILGIHKISRQPVVVEDEIVIRDVMTLSLSFDHRVIDGATSVRFMNHLKQLIERPEQLMLELK